MDRGPEVAEVGSGLVELDTGRLGLSARTVVRFHDRDGERLEVEIGAGRRSIWQGCPKRSGAGADDPDRAADEEMWSSTFPHLCEAVGYVESATESVEPEA